MSSFAPQKGEETSWPRLLRSDPAFASTCHVGPRLSAGRFWERGHLHELKQGASHAVTGSNSDQLKPRLVSNSSTVVASAIARVNNEGFGGQSRSTEVWHWRKIEH
jgi:hypothetical protein